jgi:hypothetical protein
MSLYNLDLHEKVTIHRIRTEVIRVPGGLIYICSDNHPVFVPLFAPPVRKKPKKKKKKR